MTNPESTDEATDLLDPDWCALARPPPRAGENSTSASAAWLRTESSTPAR